MIFKMFIPEGLFAAQQIVHLEKVLAESIPVVLLDQFPDIGDRGVEFFNNTAAGEVIIAKSEKCVTIKGLKEGILLAVSNISHKKHRAYPAFVYGIIKSLKDLTCIEHINIFVQISLDKPVRQFGASSVSSTDGSNEDSNLLEYSSKDFGYDY